MGFLPNSDNSLTDIQKMERELNNKFMTDEARKEAMSVLNALKNTGENNSGYATAYDYLKCVLELPFEKETFAAPEILGVIEALDVDKLWHEEG